MKKQFILIFAVLLTTLSVFAQKPKPATPAAPAKPRGPSPYVLKKDYDTEIEELKAKVNGASNTAASVRNSVEGKFNKIIVLDSQMQQVQNVLNSTSFQLAMNADSLEQTRFSMVEFEKKTNLQFAAMQEQQQSSMRIVYILFGASVVVSIVVLLVLLSLLKKRMTDIQNMLHKNEEVLKKSTLNQIEKLQKELKDESQISESRVLLDIATLKRELSHSINKEKEASLALIKTIEEKIIALEKPIDTNENLPDNDPEVFI